MDDLTENLSDLNAELSDVQTVKALKDGLSLAQFLLGGKGMSLKSLCGIYAELYNACMKAENEYDAQKFEFAYKYVADILIDSALLENCYVKCDGHYCSAAGK